MSMGLLVEPLGLSDVGVDDGVGTVVAVVVVVDVCGAVIGALVWPWPSGVAVVVDVVGAAAVVVAVCVGFHARFHQPRPSPLPR